VVDIPRRVSAFFLSRPVKLFRELDEQNCIVGICGYIVRPPRARREKPRASTFTSANIDKILK
jgi:iron complex transport system substrate-binding protein